MTYSGQVAQEETDPPKAKGQPNPKSFGNIGPGHWSRTRKEKNQESIEYYRDRSQAPGVREGGGTRNHYCMNCDGVIPHDEPHEICPHCGTKIEGKTRRYFNWVEIDQPPPSDRKLQLILLAIPTSLAAAALAWWLLR
ncbi:MAG TPA: hypothetical protein EYQ25_13060 [Planctomycetes bacterium]|nr:hypothetical protein [Planctomycetota bacterium]